ncbi:response regulator transcription factor [Vibrio sp. JC009]|uniref:response regulator transcription factor n=1 Tax=Vibrio sp. JC009 TaxID=2912314 RepID=UPI0023AF775B|nr:response regulator transcription factor [Vibrio sp. JC009]WED24857.1 response regulator transcription factor [Vibrio sp. JC009]
MAKAQLLIVEDDQEIARLTAMYLEAEGYDTVMVEDGLQAIPAIRENAPDLVILDLMLPGLSGNEICKQAREFYQKPILVLTACADDISEVSLLKLGADDYLTKPVKPHIMAARIEALLRRSTSNVPDNRYLSVGKIRIETKDKSVYFDNNELVLADAEYEMLLLLASNAGKVVSREDCCSSLRGISYDYNDRSVDMRISGLRKKLNDSKAPYKQILTVRNKGYMLVDG